jgi:hypothetical protein
MAKEETTYHHMQVLDFFHTAPDMPLKRFTSFARVPILFDSGKELSTYVASGILNGDLSWMKMSPFKSIIVGRLIGNNVPDHQPYVDLFFKCDDPKLIRHWITALHRQDIEPTYSGKLLEIEEGACVLDVLGAHLVLALYEYGMHRESLLSGISRDLFEIVCCDNMDTLKKYLDAISVVPFFFCLVEYGIHYRNDFRHPTHVFKLIKHFPILETSLRAML